MLTKHNESSIIASGDEHSGYIGYQNVAGFCRSFNTFEFKKLDEMKAKGYKVHTCYVCLVSKKSLTEFIEKYDVAQAGWPVSADDFYWFVSEMFLTRQDADSALSMDNEISNPPMICDKYQTTASICYTWSEGFQSGRLTHGAAVDALITVTRLNNSVYLSVGDVKLGSNARDDGGGLSYKNIGLQFSTYFELSYSLTPRFTTNALGGELHWQDITFTITEISTASIGLNIGKDTTIDNVIGKKFQETNRTIVDKANVELSPMSIFSDHYSNGYRIYHTPKQ